MSDVLTCSSCGAQYVGARLACVDCGIPLVDGPRLEPSDAEVGYDLADWGDGERHQLARALLGEQIASRWEELELVVKEDDADRVGRSEHRGLEVAESRQRVLGVAGRMGVERVLLGLHPSALP